MITDFERAVLVKLCQETTMAKAAHPPEHILVHRFPNLGHRVRKALNKLVSKGYVARHPTRNEMTYQLTDIGIDECRRMKEKAL
jgi:predicted transcriptional regulator